MNEIKCPHCGEVFQVDEAGYAAIQAQVRKQEFEKEVQDRADALHRELEARQRAALTEAEAQYKQEIALRKQQAQTADENRQHAIDTAVQEKEAVIFFMCDLLLT